MSSFLKKTTLLVLTAVFSLAALADEASVKKAIEAKNWALAASIAVAWLTSGASPYLESR